MKNILMMADKVFGSREMQMLVGIGCAFAGLWMIHPATALIILGAAMAVLGFLRNDGTTGRRG